MVSQNQQYAKLRDARHKLLKVCNLVNLENGIVKSPRMENALYKWVLKQKDNHVLVSGQMIKRRGKLFNKKLKEAESFIHSDGWLQKFTAINFR